MKISNRLYIFTVFLIISLFVITNQCATSTVNYGGSTGFGRDTSGFVTRPPVITPEEMIHEDIVDMDKIEYYRNLMAQKFELVLPVSVVVIFVHPTLWLYSQPRLMSEENLERIFYDTLAQRLENPELIRDIRISAHWLTHYSFQHIQEIEARYRADQCLIVGYDMRISHPSACLGFWPLSYKQGFLKSEIILLDTRTGFVLLDERYSLSQKSSGGTSAGDREKEIIFTLISEWTAQVSDDILNFYRAETD